MLATFKRGPSRLLPALRVSIVLSATTSTAANPAALASQPNQQCPRHSTTVQVSSAPLCCFACSQAHACTPSFIPTEHSRCGKRRARFHACASALRLLLPLLLVYSTLLLLLDARAPAPSHAVPQWCWLASMHHQLPRALKTWCMSLKLAHALSAFTVLEAL